ncbi:hypothetical protein X759_34590 [Mesorhizobium sp. LSHC420B00]|nr:hypothetical protein X759_34590 [Mesorhizobium sp. LSHC420B00]
MRRRATAARLPYVATLPQTFRNDVNGNHKIADQLAQFGGTLPFSRRRVGFITKQGCNAGRNGRTARFGQFFTRARKLAIGQTFLGV